MSQYASEHEEIVISIVMKRLVVLNNHRLLSHISSQNPVRVPITSCPYYDQS